MSVSSCGPRRAIDFFGTKELMSNITSEGSYNLAGRTTGRRDDGESWIVEAAWSRELATASPSERRTGSTERVWRLLLLFVCGNDAAAATRTLPVALLEVGARVSDLFTTILARHRDMFLFRHAARITESCLECILVSAGGARS